jgi:hypothetical protein
LFYCSTAISQIVDQVATIGSTLSANGSASIDFAAEITTALQTLKSAFASNATLQGSVDTAINVVAQVEGLASSYTNGNFSLTGAVGTVSSIIGQCESIAQSVTGTTYGSAQASSYSSTLSQMTTGAQSLLTNFSGTNGDSISLSTLLSLFTSFSGECETLFSAITGGTSLSGSAGVDLSGYISSFLSLF